MEATTSCTLTLNPAVLQYERSATTMAYEPSPFDVDPHALPILIGERLGELGITEEDIALSKWYRDGLRGLLEGRKRARRPRQYPPCREWIGCISEISKRGNARLVLRDERTDEPHEEWRDYKELEKNGIHQWDRFRMTQLSDGKFEFRLLATKAQRDEEVQRNSDRLRELARTSVMRKLATPFQPGGSGKPWLGTVTTQSDEKVIIAYLLHGETDEVVDAFWDREELEAYGISKPGDDFLLSMVDGKFVFERICNDEPYSDIEGSVERLHALRFALSEGEQ